MQAVALQLTQLTFKSAQNLESKGSLPAHGNLIVAELGLPKLRCGAVALPHNCAVDGHKPGLARNLLRSGALGPQSPSPGGWCREKHGLFHGGWGPWDGEGLMTQCPSKKVECFAARRETSSLPTNESRCPAFSFPLQTSPKRTLTLHWPES